MPKRQNPTAKKPAEMQIQRGPSNIAKPDVKKMEKEEKHRKALRSRNYA